MFVDYFITWIYKICPFEKKKKKELLLKNEKNKII